MPGKGTRKVVGAMRRIRRPSPATLIAVIALCVAVGGSATAAVVTSGGLGTENVTASAAKKKAKKKSKSKRTARLVGPQGQKGDQGPQGPAGVQGPAGADGVPGPSGTDGAQGSQGEAGRDGQDGEDGTDGQDGQDGDTTVRFGARIEADGSVAPPAYSNGSQPEIAHDPGSGDYRIVFTGSAGTRLIATATATLQDATAPALISTEVTNAQQASLVTVKIRALPGMGDQELPFAVQVLKMDR